MRKRKMVAGILALLVLTLLIPKADDYLSPEPARAIGESSGIRPEQEEDISVKANTEPTVISKTFVVTAYYRPLPGQKKYVTGSFEGDVSLNGSGKKTSSGSRPRRGTAAANLRHFPPKTKLIISGFGTCNVEDTGERFLKMREGGKPRLDVFTGEGDEGRERAENWGKREVEAMIILAKN